MLIEERFEIGGTALVRTYSDMGMKIKQEGTDIIYDEAVDPESMGRTYTETAIPIDGDDVTAADILNIILRGES